jgi:hypothetical protein
MIHLILTSFRDLAGLPPSLSDRCHYTDVYSVPQEERSIFWEVIVSVILSKKCISTCVLFRTVSEIELFHCTVPKWMTRQRYYIPFLIPVFIVQVTKLVQFT